MHGRLKIKTTEEQKEAKRIEREKKLKIYKAGTLKIIDKRNKKEYDEEALSLSKEFLLQNPDFYTLWNFRKEILLHLKSEKTDDEIQNLGMNELDLTQNCLKTCPKSYGAWHHRFWALNFMPHPDWNKELKHCDFFLSLDERNFHCWDYRRSICKNSNIEPKAELDFTDKLIERNFSNYSAWHYRSTLLPIVHPGPGYISVAEETLLKEYETVQNAAFTDPNDQSVWFYHRWLLGRGNKLLELISLVILKETRTVIVSFSYPIQINNSIVLTVNGAEVEVTWNPISDYSAASSVWYCELPSELVLTQDPTEISVQFKNDDIPSALKCSLNSNSTALSFISAKKIGAEFRSDISAATKDVLEKELESCRQLHELEPDNKWTLFTTVLLMKAIDSRKYHNEILSHIQKLLSVDKMREKYYQDLRSKFLIEHVIETMTVNTTELCLSSQQLSSLHHFDCFIMMQKVDLSNNNLSSVRPLQYLLCMQELILDGNKLKDCSDIKKLSVLQKLSLQSNNISEICDLDALTTCPQLKYLALSGNPVMDKVASNEIAALFSNVKLNT